MLNLSVKFEQIKQKNSTNGQTDKLQTDRQTVCLFGVLRRINSILVI